MTAAFQEVGTLDLIFEILLGAVALAVIAVALFTAIILMVNDAIGKEEE